LTLGFSKHQNSHRAASWPNRPSSSPGKDRGAQSPPLIESREVGGYPVPN